MDYYCKQSLVKCDDRPLHCRFSSLCMIWSSDFGVIAKCTWSSSQYENILLEMVNNELRGAEQEMPSCGLFVILYPSSTNFMHSKTHSNPARHVIMIIYIHFQLHCSLFVTRVGWTTTWHVSSLLTSLSYPGVLRDKPVRHRELPSLKLNTRLRQWGLRISEPSTVSDPDTFLQFIWLAISVHPTGKKQGCLFSKFTWFWTSV